MIKAPYNKFVVVNEEIETDVGSFMVDPEGRDETIDAKVIAAGSNIADVKVGDIIVYPKSRGVKAYIKDLEIRVVSYESMLYFKPKTHE